MKKYFLAFVAIFTLVTNSFSQTNIEGVEEIDSKNIGFIQYNKNPIDIISKRSKGGLGLEKDLFYIKDITQEIFTR
ncbi:MAG: hypothetical protein IPP27_14115 [Bacteroidetes bacterium]|nr:hypothetical protein [Bacteroidota bacterium]